jgi:KipI family sensor histidine kinase inhibitor
LRILEAGDSALLVEWEEVIDPRVNARAIAVAAAIRRMSLPGVRDVVSTYRTVAIFFDPLKLNADVLREAMARIDAAPVTPLQVKTVEVPVAYGGEEGPDLAAVAAWAGVSAAEVVERHAGVLYRVFMLGFIPGFAYLGTVDDRIAAPRLDTPRLRVPGGSVAIAGQQTGIYPRDSPGGWRIVGRSPLRVFDPDRTPSALLSPGDMVRFAPVVSGATHREPARPARAEDGKTAVTRANARAITILRPGLLTTVQDRGRWGHQASGVSVSGALDLVSHRLANLLVGNEPDAATLEVTLAGPEVRLEQAGRVAVTGADLQANIDGKMIPAGEAVTGRAGAVLRFGERRSGARAYVAFDGGIDVPLVLGSRATHVGAALGGLDGRAVIAGDRLPLASPRSQADGDLLPELACVDAIGNDVSYRNRRNSRSRPGPKASTQASGRVGAAATRVTGGARIRVLPGPQDDFFPEAAFALLERTRFVVTPQSNRMGYRLSGAVLPRIANREMISDAAFAGGIQVPPSGEPILLMSDRQTTGGYPQIATVITADLALAGQLAPGDWVEFVRCTRREALDALRNQEAMLDGRE